MSTLNDLKHQAAEVARNLNASAAAAAGLAQQADTLAQRLTSAGIPAVAHGHIEGLSVLVWVSAGPVDMARMDATLTRLDLAETGRIPGQTECELFLEGIDVPLYVMLPLPERVLP